MADKQEQQDAVRKGKNQASILFIEVPQIIADWIAEGVSRAEILELLQKLLNKKSEAPSLYENTLEVDDGEEAELLLFTKFLEAVQKKSDDNGDSSNLEDLLQQTDLFQLATKDNQNISDPIDGNDGENIDDGGDGNNGGDDGDDDGDGGDGGSTQIEEITLNDFIGDALFNYNSDGFYTINGSDADTHYYVNMFEGITYGASYVFSIIDAGGEDTLVFGDSITISDIVDLGYPSSSFNGQYDILTVVNSDYMPMDILFDQTAIEYVQLSGDIYTMVDFLAMVG